MSKNITLVRGDDTNFFDQVLLVVSFKTVLNLDGYKLRLTVENPTNIMKQYEIQQNAVQIDFSKIDSSTFSVGEHRANLKLIDTLGRVKTTHIFNITVQDEFEANIPKINEYEIELELDTDGINKYKNYKELSNKPSINGVELIDNKSLDELGIQPAGNYSTYEYVDGRFDTVNTEINNINIEIDNTNSILNNKANTSYVEEELNLKANKIDLDNTNAILNNKANISYVEEKLNLKADKIDLDTKANISDIPTRVSQLVNDEGYLTEHQDISNKADIDYVEELLDRKSDKSDTYTKVDVNSLLDGKQDVLIAGDNIFIDESNTIYAMVPSIVGLATKQELQQGLITKQDKGDYATNSRVNEVEGLIPDISNLATKEELQDGLDTKQPTGDYALKSEIPTKVSSFINDANYQTATDVASMIASIPQFKLSIVNSLPETGEKMTLYLVSKGGESPDVYDEYIWIEQTSSFEHLGSTAVDLSDYYTKTEADVLLADKQPKMAIVTTQNTFNDVRAFLEEGRTVYFNDSGRLLICSSMPTATIFTFQTTYHGTNMYWALCGLLANGTTSWTSGSTMVALKSELPTTTSQLTNDSGFVTQDSLLEKSTETWTFTLEDGTEVTKTMVLGV